MPGRSIRRAVVAVLVAAPAVLAGCASGGGAAPAGAEGAAPGAAPRAARSTNRSMLVAADFEGTTHTNLLDAINALRQHWLRPGTMTKIAASGSSNAGTQQQTVVFLNGQRYGEIDALAQVSLHLVRSVRYLTMTEAQGRYGARVQSPVIDIVLDQ